MSKRSSKSNVKIQSRGIFVGARVIRGYDWDWANQDGMHTIPYHTIHSIIHLTLYFNYFDPIGGEGKVGKVIDIRGWDKESRRSVANVMWASGSTNVYRIGHKGKVDLKYVADSPGPQYYRNHLPVLGQILEGSNRTAIPRSIGAESQRNSGTALFNVGDEVKVIIEDVNELKGLQEGHGGWNQRMAEFIGHIGTVHRVTEKGDIRVQFEGCHNRWTFNPLALSQVISYSVGDIVKICDDINKVKELQRCHGEWNDHMLGAIGKMGKIVKVYEDQDLRVTVDGQTWTFNPKCVSLVPGSDNETNNTTTTSHPSTREDTNSRIGNLLEPEPIQPSTSLNSEDVSVVSCLSSVHINNTITPSHPSTRENTNSRLGNPLERESIQPSTTLTSEDVSAVNCLSSVRITNNMTSHPSTREDINSRLVNQLEPEPIQPSTSLQSEDVSSVSRLSSVVTNKDNLERESAQERINELHKQIDPKVTLERLQYLESKIAEIEEANSCTICMIPYTHNGVLRMAFLCGHSACFNCAQTLKTCHMCRKTITRKINLY